VHGFDETSQPLGDPKPAGSCPHRYHLYSIEIREEDVVSINRFALSIGVAIAVVGSMTLVGAMAQVVKPGTPDASGLQWAQLTAELPAIGNVDKARQWRFGRIVGVADTTTADVFIEIRHGTNQRIRVICPRQPFAELARASRWMEADRQFPSRREFIERMIAFDVDSDDRVIGLISLEPIPRNFNNFNRGRTGRFR